MLKWLKRRWRALFRKQELEHDLEDEMRFHLERETEHNLRRGMSPEEAYYAALKSFGPMERSKEECRDVRRVRLIEEFFHDLRYGRRLLGKNPGITLIAILTLALGIGANTAIFSVVHAFLLRPLPYGDPDRLVMVDSQEHGQSTGVSFLDYDDWRKQNHVFEDLAFFNLRWNANLDFGNETETLNLTFGTSNLFSILQVSPLLGHGPTPEETHAVVLSHGLWQRRFSSDPAIVGRQLRVDGTSLTVVGVMPRDFRFPFQSDLWWLNDRYFNRERRGWRIDYFRVMEIPLLRGRVFTDRDTVRPDGHRDVAIISQRLAERMWPNGEVLGKRINCGDDGTGCAEIVGIVGDVKHNNLVEDAGYDLYSSCYQSYSKQTHFVARTQGDPMTLANDIQRAIWQAAPDTGVFNVMPVSTLSANTIWQSRVWGLLLGIFSGIALVLATAGIYGVMAYFVTQRTREIGVRIALGAQWRDVLKLVLSSGMSLVVIGLVIGLAGALVLTRLMTTLLFEVSPTDPITFGGVALCVILATLLACYIPARRATRVDPLVALRYE